MNDSRRDTYRETTRHVDIWAFNRRVSRELLSWNIVNIAAGAVLSTKGVLLRAIGSQSIGWGLINIGIAVFGQKAANRRRESLPDPDSPDVQARERRNLTRLLAINAGLDLLYIWGGFRLARRRGAGPRTVGIGIGIMVQGLLLYLFDKSLLRDLEPAPVEKPAFEEPIGSIGMTHVSDN
ncbi:MAG: hypothetical protein IPM16_05235 [Chloroflexi bacterium]|nr:hypothetical protein [Chloroflexota bacterium]